MRMFGLFCGLLSVLLAESWGQKIHIPEEEKHGEYWEHEAQNYLQDSLELQKNDNVAKNVILFLGDGMGLSTVTSIRIMKGQLNGKGGEDERLVFDEFPHVSLSKTYGMDRQTSDSANSATAYLCGVKANYRTIGVDGRVQFEDCEASLDPSTHAHSILKWAQDEGKWTGVITTTRVTHATPAGSYAHTSSRNWEGTSPDNRCKDIASQLIEDIPGKNIRVIMGGGAGNFVPQTKRAWKGEKGYRPDRKNLIRKWLHDKKSKGAKPQVVFNVKQLQSVDTDNVDYLLGLFSNTHLPYVLDRPKHRSPYPSLKEMTEVAIKILSRGPKGFFLLVEGGHIDLAHHDNWAHKALIEGVEFDRAIDHTINVTSEDDTLIVVTADHSHTFVMGGDHPLRGNSILGVGGVSDEDNKTFTTVGYFDGPGYKVDGRKYNLTESDFNDPQYRQDTAVPLVRNTHGGEDVAVYARGPMAHLYHGVHDESYIPYAMGYAACVGPNHHHCDDGDVDD